MITATACITAYGHPKITAMHRSTFEVTTHDEVTKAGDCIIAVGADIGCAGLSREFKDILSHDGAVLTTTLLCNGLCVTVTSRGSSQQTFDHPHDLVWRRSDYVCGRTIGIYSSHTAEMLPREIVHELQQGAPIRLILSARYDPSHPLT